MYILIFQGTFEDEISLSQGGIWNSSLEGMYIYIYIHKWNLFVLYFGAYIQYLLLGAPDIT